MAQVPDWGGVRSSCGCCSAGTNRMPPSEESLESSPLGRSSSSSERCRNFLGNLAAFHLPLVRAPSRVSSARMASLARIVLPSAANRRSRSNPRSLNICRSLSLGSIHAILFHSNERHRQPRRSPKIGNCGSGSSVAPTSGRGLPWTPSCTALAGLTVVPPRLDSQLCRLDWTRSSSASAVVPPRRDSQLFRPGGTRSCAPPASLINAWPRLDSQP